MTDDRFEEFVRRVAPEYHRPPETPRDRIWERIVAERRKRRQGRQRQQAPRWVRWGLAAAAVLAVGIAIGRFTAIQPPGSPPLAGNEVTGGVEDSGTLAYQVAAVQHLRQVETFLTVFRTDAGTRPIEGAPASARALLAGTRLLMDSPAGQDQQVAALLKDIELVLAQVALFTRDDGSDELDLIQQGMERRGVLLKLSVATAQGAL